MWRSIKFLFYAAVIIVVVLAMTGKKIGGKTVQEYIQGLISNGGMRDSLKDIRVMVGEAIKAVGTEISSEEVTDAERKELNGLVKDALEHPKPIPGAANQTALPPEKKPTK